MRAARRILETVRGSGPLWAASLVVDRAIPANVLGLWPERVVQAETLAEQLRAVFRAWGMPEEHVEITVGHMLYADLRGIDSHGCGMLLHYHRARAAGSLTATPEVRVVQQGETTALVDGGGGLGHVPADTAIRLAISKCERAGIAAVAVRNSGHFGAAGAYAALAAEAGLIGIATTGTDLPAVVPTSGLEAMLGTNPIAFAAPAARNPPFLLDMATSTVPLGRLMTAWRRGAPIPAGWALDPQGRALTDARAAARHRRLTPLGSTPEMASHKGYGLAAMVEILSSVLSGSRPPRGSSAPRLCVGHFFAVLDPARFRGEGEFQTDLDDLLDGLRASRPADPATPVLVAGDPEQAALAERAGSGIPLPRGIVEDIRSVARSAGAPFMLDARA